MILNLGVSVELGGGQHLVDNFYLYTNLYKIFIYMILINVSGGFLGVATKYSKRMFLNTHHYSNLGYCSSLL